MKKLLAASFLLSAAAWLLFSWPLPRHAIKAIPSSASNIEPGHVRTMIAGDHLQLMYHFWLLEDSLFGKTPWFTNPYEFRLSEATPPGKPRAYYLPFSLLYAAAAQVAGRAAAWNLTGFMSLWASCIATWLLARRYAMGSDMTALAAAALSLILPFRWHAMLGGSPTGFAVSLAPALFLGLDTAVRNASLRGGLLAGAALLASALSDRHMFYFGALASPFWLAVASAAAFADPAPRPPMRRRAAALIPFAVLAPAAYLLLRLTTRSVESSVMAAGRSIQEVALFCRTPDGLFLPSSVFESEIMIGLVAASAVAIPLTAMFIRAGKSDRKAIAAMVSAAMLVTALAVISILAVGVNGPRGGALFVLCRDVLPKFDMIRQPAKVFCLAPSFLAVAFAAALSPFLRQVPARRAALALTVILAACTVEYRRWVNPTVCVLANDQPAYAAAAASRQAGRPPHALAIPLWPGDSHWSSLYQYYSSLYRLPMVNGYSPAAAMHYSMDVFPALAPLNKGWLDGPILAELKGMGVGSLIFHENAFPEKVSPFPGCHTLKRLLTHPQLRLMKRSGSVWTFAIEPRGADAPLPPAWDFFCPARNWQSEQGSGLGVELVRSPCADGGAFIEMPEPGTSLTFPRTRALWEDGMRVLFRLRGAGELTCETVVDGEPVAAESLRLASPDWTWIEADIPRFEGHRMLQMRIAVTSGHADSDTAILAAGDRTAPSAAAPLRIPAPCLFHYGETNPERNTVLLRASDIASYEAI